MDNSPSYPLFHIVIPDSEAFTKTPVGFSGIKAEQMFVFVLTMALSCGKILLKTENLCDAQEGMRTTEGKTYIAIDLKSFYASVECVDRGLDTLKTNLVVADASRTDKTICLAVSPSLKAFGIPGRPRLFEVVQKVRDINNGRRYAAPGRAFRAKSHFAPELAADPSLELDYIVAPPRMARYMEVSRQIYSVYLKYASPEDIHVYSIDEVFIDVTKYLRLYGVTAHEFTMMLVRDVLSETGITATAGIGSNMYLCKIAMDIVAKKSPADADGVRIAELDEYSYRRLLWDHRPLTDFWRIGHGISRRLETNGMFTMGDIARMSLYSENKLYKLFGINAELLIDHAWGWEPCEMKDIKSYVPQSNSLSSGQVLQRPYPFDKARLVTREMTDLMVLDIVEKGLVTEQMILTIGYDNENLRDPERLKKYRGAVDIDHYGRAVPKSAHGSVNLGGFTSSTRRIMEAVTGLFDRIVDPALTVRRICSAANHISDESRVSRDTTPVQLDFFTDPEASERRAREETRERGRQRALIGIKNRYGKNAILRGMNFEKDATARDRNRQVGGHRA